MQTWKKYNTWQEPCGTECPQVFKKSLDRIRVQAYDYKDRCAHTFFVRKQQKLSTVRGYMGILRAGWNKLKHIVLPNPAGYESHLLVDNHRIKAFAVEGSTSLGAVEGCIDNVSNWRGLGVFFFHRLVADNPGIYHWRIPDFQSLVEHIAAKNVDVFTFTQFFKKYRM